MFKETSVINLSLMREIQIIKIVILQIPLWEVESLKEQL